MTGCSTNTGLYLALFMFSSSGSCTERPRENTFQNTSLTNRKAICLQTKGSQIEYIYFFQTKQSNYFLLNWPLRQNLRLSRKSLCKSIQFIITDDCWPEGGVVGLLIIWRLIAIPFKKLHYSLLRPNTFIISVQSPSGPCVAPVNSFFH